jgi:2-oxoglutarate-Fe(II)-dependent oxygenase superfamily protein
MPIQTKIRLPTDSTSNWLHILSNLLSDPECIEIINQNTHSLEPQAASFTSRSRCIFEDAALASTLWTRLSPFYSKTQYTDEDGYQWHATHINDHFRFCKYVSGDGFTPHIDGEKLLDVDIQAMITVNIYLNTLPEECQGATRIIQPLEEKEQSNNASDDLHSISKVSNHAESVITFQDKIYQVLYSVYPVAGSAAVFPSNGPLHDGAPVKAGEKFLLRTDIVFQRSPAFTLSTDIIKGLNGDEKVKMASVLGKKALDMASKLEDGGSVSAWKWYKLAFQLNPALEGQ